MTKPKMLHDVLNDPNSFTSRIARMGRLVSPSDALIEARLSKKEKEKLEQQLHRSRRKTKLNLKDAPKRDQVQTPPYALIPLLPYIPRYMTIWESAAGEGYMVQALRNFKYTVVGTELLRGVDFFKTPWISGTDVQVTNPPWSNPLKFEWIEHSYELLRPFALLMPLETWGAARAQRQFQQHGVSVILLNRRVNFKMPLMGWEDDKPIWDEKKQKMVKRKSSSDMPVAWFCWGLPFLKEAVTYGEIPPLKSLPEWMVKPSKPADY